MTTYTVDDAQLPDWFKYPPEYIRIASQHLVDLTPWHLLVGSDALGAKRLAEHYPSRALFPFASRQDCDDVACWERGREGQVVIIHDFASPGWENEGLFESFWAWFRAAIEDTINWE